MLCRPKDARQVGFCNCASYSTVVVDVPGSDHAYDRLLLADLCGQHAADPEAFICPPSYQIKNGGLTKLKSGPNAAEVETVDELWNGERPVMWFLKENSRNYGQGIDICATAAEALAIAEKNEAEDPGKGREYVLQPHVVNPLLYEDTYKFHIRVYALIVTSPSNRYPRNFAHITGKMPISARAWQADCTDKDMQITTARGEFAYEDWEHYDVVHPKLLDTTAILLEQLEPKLGPQAWTGRAAFELLGLDYMLDKDMRPYLLEVNTGPVLKVEDDMEIISGLTNIIFGTAEQPLEGVECGTGPAEHGWVELNHQVSTPARRKTQIDKLVKWLTLRTQDPDCSLCLEEELVKYCIDELTAFAQPFVQAPADLESAGASSSNEGENPEDSAAQTAPDGAVSTNDTDVSPGLRAVVDAGAVDACLSVLDDGEMEDLAKVHAVALLAEMFDYDEIAAESASIELIERVLPLMDYTQNDDLQALATTVVTSVVDALGGGRLDYGYNALAARQSKCPSRAVCSVMSCSPMLRSN